MNNQTKTQIPFIVIILRIHQIVREQSHCISMHKLFFLAHDPLSQSYLNGLN